jgi:NADH-quinone oxidoreductase subunit F
MNNKKSLCIQDNTDLAEIDQIVAEIGRESGDVIPVLQAIQERYHYLPEPALQRVCEITDITPASITGVATFYSQFRNRPAGRHFIKVCIGTACHVMGGETIFQTFKQHLDIAEDDDTDSERLFTVEKVACLGCCMLAPAIQIDDITYGFLNTQKVPLVIRDFLEAQTNQSSKPADVKNKNLPRRGEVRMCLCSSCTASGTKEVYAEFQEQVGKLVLPALLKIVGCTGMAYQTPLIDIVMQDGRRFQYGKVKPRDVRAILLRHFRPATIKHRASAVVTRILEKLLTDKAWEPVTRYAIDTRNGADAAYSYEESQHHLVTEHCGSLTPLDIDEYIAHDGFKALEQCLNHLSPKEIIRQVDASELRGRGGAGFPTGKKWRAVKEAGGEEKYIICNGDEGDPGAFMDRLLLESFPFRVIEGIIIASRALGATEGFLYIRAEYPLAIARIREALRICRERGYLGNNIMSTRHSFKLSVSAGAGAFVCGEETALIAAIQGQRGMPRIRPPFPAENGLHNKPTLVNNVETFALIPWIIRHGPGQFASLGTQHSKGTKTFALAGKIVRSGLIEAPMGMTLREIVEEIGGGIPNGKRLKAIQVGGPSGGCVPASLADTPVDYEALVSAGAMMGSGGMVVLDETDCMVDIARYFMTFTQEESCGKCTYCRIGTRQMLEILECLCQGKGKSGDIEKLEHLANVVKNGSLCGLGKTAPNPVLSTLKHFKDEYEAHINGKCPAKKCKDLITYSITDKCIGCTRCAQHCPVGSIKMKPYEKHEIDPKKCIKCGTCQQVCTLDAVAVV